MTAIDGYGVNRIDKGRQRGESTKQLCEASDREQHFQILNLKSLGTIDLEVMQQVRKEGRSKQVEEIRRIKRVVPGVVVLERRLCASTALPGKERIKG